MEFTTDELRILVAALTGLRLIKSAAQRGSGLTLAEVANIAELIDSDDAAIVSLGRRLRDQATK